MLQRRKIISHLLKRVHDIVLSHGKQVMGWDEISLSELSSGTVAQYWANKENAAQGCESGCKNSDVACCQNIY